MIPASVRCQAKPLVRQTISRASRAEMLLQRIEQLPRTALLMNRFTPALSATILSTSRMSASLKSMLTFCSSPANTGIATTDNATTSMHTSTNFRTVSASCVDVG